jgi:predicted phage terminase large subunit-like protein
MSIDRKTADTIYRNSFGAFVYAVYEALYPGRRLNPAWHVDTICFAIQMMVAGESTRRLVVNLPPRTLKTFILSVCLPAWLLGRDPSARILCASYSRELAEKFSRDCRALMETPFYKRVFPRTRLNPKKSTEGEFETTRRGYRLATSVGGTLTGRGGDVLIIDDPVKADDANSKVAIDGANEWLRNTALSRLDSPQDSLIIINMQRLHANDMSGMLIEQGWPRLAIPAIAVEPVDYLVGKDETYHRPVGQLLQPNRDTAEGYEEIQRRVGSRVWSAQYQQNPTPPEGNIIKARWLGRYDFDAKDEAFERIIISCDPAGKAGEHNDYTAITVIGLRDKLSYVLEVARGHWTVMPMKERILTLMSEWNADLVIIEDTASGMSLIPLLRESSYANVVGRCPDTDKVNRMRRHEGRFEAGRILFPNEAQWLAEFEGELLGFPSSKYDDQVDALLLYLDWLAEHEWESDTFVIPVPPKFFTDRHPGGSYDY